MIFNLVIEENKKCYSICYYNFLLFKELILNKEKFIYYDNIIKPKR